MYAILNFSSGWITHADKIAKAINSLVCGASLASLQATHLAGTTFNLSKSRRKADVADHFWIQDTDYICHAPCDTPSAQNKYARFGTLGGHISFDLGTNVQFTSSSNSYVLNTNASASSSSPINIHVQCTKRGIVTSIAVENEIKPAILTVLSEITYEAMPYMDDNTGTFVPAVISSTLIYNPQITGASNTTQNPFKCPAAITNSASGTVGAISFTNWRVGNTNIFSQPLSTTVGNTRQEPGTMVDVEAFLPLGVAAQNMSNAIFVGCITDKSGIMIMNGLGYPEESVVSKGLPPDIIVTINGKDYVALDKILVPYI